MKNNEMGFCGIEFSKLPEKFVDDHPNIATAIYFSPVLIPLVCKGVKYLVDTVADCYRYRVMVENNNGLAHVVNDLETIPSDSIEK